MDNLGYTLVSTPRWIPAEGEKYLTIEYAMIKLRTWENDRVDRFNLKLGFVFETDEEAQEKLEEINSREI